MNVTASFCPLALAIACAMLPFGSALVFSTPPSLFVRSPSSADLRNHLICCKRKRCSWLRAINTWGEDYAIRPYNDATDRARLLELIQELQGFERNLYDRMKPSDEIGVEYIHNLTGQCRMYDGAILVAESDETLVGYACVLTRVPSSESDEIPHEWGQVVDLAVTATARGRAFGSALLRACEEKVRDAGCRYIRTSVLAGNGGAARLYERVGFKPHLVEMEKDLQEER